MRRSCLLVALLCLASATAAAAQMLDYPTSSLFLPETPGVTAGALGGLFNPAALGVNAMGKSELATWWRDQDDSEDWGVSTSGLFGPGAFGLAAFEQDDDTLWQLGTSGGNRAARAGLAYRWGPEDALVAGLLLQPRRELSLGASGAWSMDTSDRQGVFDLGLRPLGTPVVTLYADYTLDRETRIDDGRWAAGIAIRPVRGLQLGASAREMVHGQEAELLLHAGITTAGFLGLDYVQRGDGDARAFALRVNPPSPGLELGLAQRTYAVVDLEHKYVTYQKFQWMDDRRVAWLDLLRQLDAIAADPHVDGVVVNLADTAIRPSLAWELRQSLQELQGAGKEVVVHADRLDFMGYYLASVADRLVVDPEGDIVLQGVAMRRTYLKGMLEKMGVGFQELRYFTYKSAMETYSRSEMSEADREQRQRVVEVDLRDGARGRLREPQADDGAVRRPRRRRAGLLAPAREGPRPDRRHRPLGGCPRPGCARSAAAASAAPRPPTWRAPTPSPTGASPSASHVVYAVGECAMDTGIRGRKTSDYLLSLARRRDVAGVVLRADSPGGDPLAQRPGGRRRPLAARAEHPRRGQPGRRRGVRRLLDQHGRREDPHHPAHPHRQHRRDRRLVLGRRHRREDRPHQRRRPDGPPRRPDDRPALPAGGDVVARARPRRAGTGTRARLRHAGLRRVRQARGARPRTLRGRGPRRRRGPRVDGRGRPRARALRSARLPARRDRPGARPRRPSRTTARSAIVEYPPRQLLDFGALLGGGGGLPSFPFGLLQPFAGVWSALAADTPAAADLRDYVEVYVQTLAANPGRGAVVLSPDDLPEGWRVAGLVDVLPPPAPGGVHGDPGQDGGQQEPDGGSELAADQPADQAGEDGGGVADEACQEETSRCSLHGAGGLVQEEGQTLKKKRPRPTAGASSF